MNANEFCYWLRGFMELQGPEGLSKGLTGEQLRMVDDHLGLVFQKVTPNRDLKSPVPPPEISSLERAEASMGRVSIDEFMRRVVPQCSSGTKFC